MQICIKSIGQKNRELDALDTLNSFDENYL
jgi:hypothetical protein